MFYTGSVLEGPVRRWFGALGKLRYQITEKLFGWAVPGRHPRLARWRPVLKQIPNVISLLRILAPYASARAIRAFKRGDWPAFTFWSSLALTLFFLDAIDGPAADLLDAKSREGAWLDSNMDKWAFLRILRQLHHELRIREVGFEAFMSELVVRWRAMLDLSLAAVSTEATFRGFDNKAKFVGKIKFPVDVASLIVGYAAMLSPERHRTKVRRLHRTLVVVAICLAAASLNARLKSRHQPYNGPTPPKEAPNDSDPAAA